ncbi:F-box-like protein [Ceratobasidium sp. AG-Ba]|nr:F-box-like protein [Ceratobasidium sp. AG-Ba]
MEPITRWNDSLSKLKSASSDFIDACSALESATSSNQLRLLAANTPRWELLITDINSQINQRALEESKLYISNAMFSRLLNEPLRAPITKLAAETLSYIFHIATASSPCFPAANERDMLLDLQLVCTSWRQVALGKPYLWSHIGIHAMSSNEELSMKMAQHLRMSLKCTCRLPIHIHIDITHDSDNVIPPGLNSALGSDIGSLASLKVGRPGCAAWLEDLFRHCVKRGTSSSLNTFIHEPFDESFVVPKGLFSGLVNLNFSCLNKFSLIDHKKLAANLSNAPDLRTLHLHGICVFDQDWVMNTESILVEKLHLSSLRVRQLYDIHGMAEKIVLLLYPGNFELDVRLGFIETSPIDYHQTFV